jgi:hypothetical protein
VDESVKAFLPSPLPPEPPLAIDSAVVATLAAGPPIELEEVDAVVRHHRSLGRLRVLEEVLVGESSELSTLTDRLDIVVARPAGPWRTISLPVASRIATSPSSIAMNG